MASIVWQQFGIRKDPYDTMPLVEGGDLPIKEAFVGREKEREMLHDFCENTDHLALAICGGIGVGKTSLANVHKFIWKYYSKKLLFSFRREIEASETLLDKKSFLLEIMGSVIREIKLLQPSLLGIPLLKKLQQVFEFSQALSITGGISVPIGAFTANLMGERTPQYPPQLSTVILEGYFRDLIDFLRTQEVNGFKYSGLLIHVNNFDVVMGEKMLFKKTRQFFHEIRDLLQTPHAYFLFLGPENFYIDMIAGEQRLKAVFSPPLRVLPLSKKEIVMALRERVRLLKSDDVKEPIYPVEDGFVFRLYDLYQGDIRSIMASIRDVLSQQADRLMRPLSSDEALLLLGKERWERIKKQKLTREQVKILKFLTASSSWVTQTDIVKMFRKARPNVSAYYFKPLKEAGVIEEKEKQGKIKYWGLTDKFVPLKWMIESQQRLAEKMTAQTDQLPLL